MASGRVYIHVASPIRPESSKGYGLLFRPLKLLLILNREHCNKYHTIEYICPSCHVEYTETTQVKKARAELVKMKGTERRREARKLHEKLGCKKILGSRKPELLTSEQTLRLNDKALLTDKTGTDTEKWYKIYMALYPEDAWKRVELPDHCRFFVFSLIVQITK